jgi:TetR/AcrR family transcriptional regulator
MGVSTEPGRSTGRSRNAILDAAERLFAERGYEATSLNEVGAAAGVSRGTPGYFFGSKEELYRAVLERCFARVRAAVRSGRDRALASHENPSVILAGAVAEYFDFISSNANFVRLMEWEALGGGRHLRDVPPHLEVIQEALGAIVSELALDPSQRAEAMQLLLSIIALCWFPMVHAGTVVQALGVDPANPRFLEERRRHVIGLVLQGMERRVVAPGADAIPSSATDKA